MGPKKFMVDTSKYIKTSWTVECRVLNLKKIYIFVSNFKGTFPNVRYQYPVFKRYKYILFIHVQNVTC